MMVWTSWKQKPTASVEAMGSSDLGCLPSADDDRRDHYRRSTAKDL